MCCVHVDGPQRFRIEPVIAMTKAEPANRADLAVDDSKFKFAIGRCCFDVSPLRGFEKPGQNCGKFFDDHEFELWCWSIRYLL